MKNTTSDPWSNPSPSLAAKLAAFFHRHENQWIDGRVLSQIAGYAAWRTRCSDLRRPPFNMHVINRQRHADVGGKTITISEYKFVVQNVGTDEDREGAAEGVSASSAAV